MAEFPFYLSGDVGQMGARVIEINPSVVDRHNGTKTNLGDYPEKSPPNFEEFKRGIGTRFR